MYYIVTRNEPRCVYCEMAKNLANKAGLEYTIVPIETMLDFMKDNGLKTIPLVFKDQISMSHYIGGHTEFQKHVYSN